MSDLAALGLAVALVVAGALVVVAALIVAARRGRRVHLELEVNGHRRDDESQNNDF